jgi:hypothetical protein
MAEQIINIGTTANDGTGDTLRESQRKSKENFAELYSLSGGAVNIDGKEDKTNKQNDLTADVTNLKYPTVTAVNTGLATKQNTLTNPITGTGTTNFLPKFTGASTLGNSILSDSGGILNVSGSGVFSSSVTANGVNASNGLLNSQNRLLLTGSNPLSSWISSAITSGYDATTSQGFLNADGSLLLATNGVSRLTLNSTGATFASSVTANSLAITTAPLTSSGTPPILTYNAATKAIESVPYNNIAASANSILLTGNQSFTGVKSSTVTGGNTNAMSFINESNIAGSQAININVSNTGSVNAKRGITITNNNVGTDSGGSQGAYIENNSSGTGIQIKNLSNGLALDLNNGGAGTGDLLNAGGTVTRINSTGKLITTATPTSATDVTNKTYVDSKSLYNNLSISTNRTVTIADFVNTNELIIFANATSANLTITLPNASLLSGYSVTVKLTASTANSVTITGNANIDGASTLILSGQYSKSKITSNATQYFIL